MRTLVSALILVALVIPATAAPPPEDVVRTLTETIRKHCSDATIEVTDNGFTAKYGTLIYTLHSRSKTGEVYAHTYQQEGPNYRGFMLNVALHDGKYEGAATVPQTLQGPYFPTFLDAVPLDKATKHYQVRFSYGSRLDRELMKAIVDAIPTSRLQQAAGDRVPQP